MTSYATPSRSSVVTREDNTYTDTRGDTYYTSRGDTYTRGGDTTYGDETYTCSPSQYSINIDDGDYYDTVEDEDNLKGVNGIFARCSATLVGSLLTTRKILIIMRLLKAVTFGMLLLSICSGVMYLCFVAFVVDEEYFIWRDIVIRVYGILFSIMGVLVEMDIKTFRTNFLILKSFFFRAFFYFFIATISQAHSLKELSSGIDLFDENYNNNRNYNFQRDDDAYVPVDDDKAFISKKHSDIPGSAMVFAFLTSVLLYGCSFVYLLFGFLCCDRLTAKALREQMLEHERSTEITDTTSNTPYNRHDHDVNDVDDV